MPPTSDAKMFNSQRVAYLHHLIYLSNENSLVRKLFSKTVIALLLGAIVSLITGCSTSIPRPDIPESEYVSVPGKVIVLASTRVPETKFEGYKGEGAAAGATACFKGAAESNNGLAVLIAPIVCTILAPVGAAIGAVRAPGSNEVETTKDSLLSAWRGHTIQEVLRDEVVKSAHADNLQLAASSLQSTQEQIQSEGNVDYRQYAASGVDTVLEVSLTKLGLENPKHDSLLNLFMEARARLIRTTDNKEVYSGYFSHKGMRVELSEWKEDKDRLLREINTGLEKIGTDIYEKVFLLYPFPNRKTTVDRLGDSFGLAAIEPSKHTLHWDTTLNYYAHADSVQPTLQWEKFPRLSDIDIAPKEMSRVTNVRYDLMIFQLKNDNTLANSDPVFRRNGLINNFYSLEMPLKPGTRYRWTVRANFNLDGRTRVTEWSSSAHYLLITP